MHCATMIDKAQRHSKDTQTFKLRPFHDTNHGVSHTTGTAGGEGI